MGAPTFAVGCDAGGEIWLLCHPTGQAVFALDAQAASKADKKRGPASTEQMIHGAMPSQRSLPQTPRDDAALFHPLEELTWR